MNGQSIKYSIAIPTYRGAANLPELIERVVKIMNQIDGRYEIILVDDASPDNSWEIIRKLKDVHPEMIAFRLMNNVGQFRALMCAFDRVRGEYVITMDDDLQNPPEEIPKLIRGIEGYPEIDGVIGSFTKKEHSPGRNLGSFLIELLNRLVSGKPRTLKTTSFRLLRRGLVEAIAAHKTINPVMGPLVVQSSKRLVNVMVDHHQRKSGQSNYNFAALAKMALDHVLNFSTIPLRAMVLTGFFSSALSLVLGIYYLANYLTGNIGREVQGWTTLVLLLIFFSGLILFSVGLIGEYLLRIINEVNRSPRYTIRDTL